MPMAGCHKPRGKYIVTEEIEWIVLAIEENRALVISKYALDCQQYNTVYTDVTWESCSLRKWLNSSFLNAAFNSTLQELIPSVSVPADKSPEYNTNPGNDTTDKVFLLSISEAEKYFSSDIERQCTPTKYAIANGAYVYSNGSCWWWLRSPASRQYYAAGVRSDSSFRFLGHTVHRRDDCVRPALWINLG